MSSEMFLELILLVFFLNGAIGQLSITPSGIVDVTENSELTIACSYTGSSTYNLVKWRKYGGNVYTRYASNCNRFGGQPVDPNVAEFTCNNNGKDLALILKTVKREQDGEEWSCSVDTALETLSEGVTIKIKVQVTSVELQKNGVTISSDTVEVDIGVHTLPPFSCNIIPSTSRPPPTVIWYIGSTVRQNSTSTSYTVTASETEHDQRIYCKAYNLQPEGQAVESGKPKLYVRVQVTSVELQRNGNTINTDKVEVNIGALSIPPFDCIITPSNSRPDPTVIWYIGLVKKQQSTSTSFSVTASETDHNKTIYCKAYNLQPESQAVESSKPKLYVRVQVNSVELQRNGVTINTDTVEVDISKPTTLACNIIPGNSRPAPTVIWYIGTDVKQNLTSTSYQVTATEADNDQIIYCKAYNRPWNHPVESTKPNILVRVPVPNVQLDTGNLAVNGLMFQVTAGSPVSLNCKPGFSRPSATIDWYIQSSQTQTRVHTQTFPNTEYILTAEINYHLDQIFCQAYIPRQVPKAESPKFTLYVNVKVTSVTLMYQGNTPSTGEPLTFTAGTPEPLTCTPSFCRPEATIDWYIGNNSKQSSTSQTYSLNALYADHDKPIYCKGYNNVTSDTERPVSNKPVLYVRVPAEVPSILNESTGGLTLLDGDSSTVQCQSTPTRPAATISWKIGNSVLSDTNTREVTEAGGLVSIISTLSLVVQQVFDNTDIICQSKINGQTGTPETRKLLKVWWRPSKPSVQTINGDFPWVERGRGQLTCVSDDHGNPRATIKWTSNIGTMNAQNQLVIDSLSYLDHKRSIKCGVENAFTEIKDEIVESKEITLNVQFSPKFLTIDDVFVGNIKETVNITFHIYCNPKVDTAKLYVNGSVTNDNEKYVLMTTEGVSEELNLTVTIMDLEEGDFANYLLEVTNPINTTEVNFTVTAESIPSPPTAFGLKELRGSIAIFYWERGFNGGHKQHFLLQLKSETEGSWSNRTIVGEHNTNSNLGNSSYVASISNLNPGTYKVRLIAANVIGVAEPVMLESTFTIPTTETTSNSSVGAIAGGVTAGVLVVIIILASVLILKYLRRKGFITKSKSKSLQPESDPLTTTTCLPKKKEKMFTPLDLLKILKTANYEDLSQIRGNSSAYDNIGASFHADHDSRNEESTYEGLKPSLAIEQTYSSLKQEEYTNSETTDSLYTNLKLN